MIQLPRAPMRRGPEDSEDGASLRCGESESPGRLGRTWRRVRPFSLLRFDTPLCTYPGRPEAILRSVPETRSLREVLSAMADDLIDRLEADACALSRVIGDVLILVAERVPDGRTLLQGQGYLVPDYP